MFFLFFRFLFFFQLINESNCVKDDDIAILSQMQDWGSKINTVITGKESGRGQYLVAAVLSDNALSKPNELSKTILQGCPNKPNTEEKIIECSTSAVILNKINEETWRQSEWKNENKYKNHPWHGEYRLVNTGIIERLIKNFHKVNGNHNNCQVYLYSFFIPCADIPGCPYSCADQVAQYNNRGDIKCKITVIGYTNVFSRSNTMKTNKDRANTVLRTGMDIYQTVKDVKVEAIKEVRSSKKQTFQYLIFSCLLDSPLSGCCVDDKETKTNSQLVIAYFVNAMVYKAVMDSKFANKRMSQACRNDLEKYFDKWLEIQIHTDCSICSDRSTESAKFQRFLISFCAKTALDLSETLGKPTDPRDLSAAKWEPYTGKWTNIYTVSPKQFLNTRPIKCADISLSVDSLCTRRDVTTLKIPSNSMSRKRERLGDYPAAKQFRRNE